MEKCYTVFYYDADGTGPWVLNGVHRTLKGAIRRISGHYSTEEELTAIETLFDEGHLEIGNYDIMEHVLED